MRTKENKKSKNKILVLIIIVGLLFVLPLIIIFLNIDYIKAYKTLDSILDYTDIDDDIMIPEGILKVMNEYNGDIKSYKVVLKSIKNVTENVLPNYYIETKNLSDDELQNYFEKNNKIIAMEIGIDNFTDFKNLCNELKKISTDEIILEGYSIDTTSVNVIYNRVEAVLNVKYQNNQNINLVIVLKNITKNKFSPIMYTISNK